MFGVESSRGDDSWEIQSGSVSLHASDSDNQLGGRQKLATSSDSDKQMVQICRSSHISAVVEVDTASTSKLYTDSRHVIRCIE